MEIVSPDGAEVIVRSSADTTSVGDWALVLEAAGIAHRVTQTQTKDSWVVTVSPTDLSAAAGALDAYDAESRAPQQEAALPPQADSILGIVVAVLLLAAYVVMGPRDTVEPTAWFRAGSASAELIVRGQWWRAVTALTLHADLLHLFGNAVASLIFVAAVGRWLGSGVAALLILLGGTAGNLLTAIIHRTGHISVGASTATFAALGILAGLQVVRRLRFGPLRRRAWLPLGAGLALFAMLGVGERSDIFAHLFGLGTGCLLGAAAALVLPRRLRSTFQVALGVVSLTLLILSWALAFR
ncbi:MAG TPA: rhomboid family intramembrane serine protease [Polyangia bacterium]|nr:rhomboid family intramembrane serine protease [Polyangia bacterium]